MLQLQSYLFGLLVILLARYGVYSWKRRRLYRMASKIPGPSGVPFFGEALSVLGSDHSKAFRSLTSLAKDYATPSRIWYGPYCAIILDNPKDLQIVLNSPKSLEKAEVYQFIGLLKGLVVADVNMWRVHRKILDPAFNMSVLKSFMPMFNDKMRILVREMRKISSQQEVDIFQQISACTLETLLLSSSGVERDIQSNASTNKYLHDVDVGTKVMNDRLFKVWLHVKPIYRLSNTYKLWQKYVQNGIFAIADEILKEVRAEGNGSDKSRQHKIVIDQLLDEGNSLTNEEIVDEINTLIGAVSETSSCVIERLKIHLV